MEVPTHEDLLDKNGLKSVLVTEESGWRHGVDRYEVWERSADGTFWSACYKVSTDGETNELRDGECAIFQVEPYETTVTAYRAIQPKESK